MLSFGHSRRRLVSALAVQVADLKFLQPRDFDSLELPVIQRRKLAACIDGLRGNAHKEL